MPTVLVVDDRPVDRGLVRTILGHAGYDVLEAGSGAEALQMLGLRRPDLVISDVLMPDMDGYELARDIRATPGMRQLPIVFYTANYLEQETRPIAAACGVDHVVAKDGDPRALIDAVADALRGGQRHSPEVADEDFSREHLRLLNAKLLEKVRELEEKQRLTQLVDAAIVVSGDLGLQTTLDRIAGTARSLVAADAASVTLCDGGGFEIGAGEDGVAPEYPDPSVSRISVTLAVNGGQRGQLVLTGKQTAGAFSDDDERLLAQFADAAAAAIANAHLYDEAQRRQAWLRAAGEVTALLLGADPSDALPTIVARARTVANAAVAWIEPAGNGQSAPTASAHGRLGRSAASVLGAQMLKRVAAASTPVTVDDPALELSRSGAGADLGGDLDGLGALLAVPMHGREDLLGVLVLGNRRHGRPFTALDIEMVTTFAGQAAIAVEFGRARADRERLRVVEERHRIARDLHDIVIQRLFATGLRLEQLAGTLPDAPAGHVRDATGELDRTIDDIREAIFSLRNAQQPPLRRQLLSVIARVQRGLGVTPDVVIDDEIDAAVPEALWPFLVATISEALTNVGKHAAADRVEVVVSVRGADLVVQVVDDGCGLPVQRIESGLANLRHRAELAGGRVTTEPGSAGRGLVLTSQVPLPA